MSATVVGTTQALVTPLLPPRPPTFLGPSAIKPGDKIDSHQQSTDGHDKTHFVVHFKGTSATGTLHESYTNHHGVSCHTGTINFQLKLQ